MRRGMPCNRGEACGTTLLRVTSPRAPLRRALSDRTRSKPWYAPRNLVIFSQHRVRAIRFSGATHSLASERDMRKDADHAPFATATNSATRIEDRIIASCKVDVDFFSGGMSNFKIFYGNAAFAVQPASMDAGRVGGLPEGVPCCHGRPTSGATARDFLFKQAPRFFRSRRTGSCFQSPTARRGATPRSA